MDYQIRRHSRANGHIVDTHPSVEPVLELYEQRVVDIIGTCRQKGVRPVFVTQPTLWTNDGEQDEDPDLWTGRIRGTDKFLSIPKLRELLDRFNTVVISVCATYDVPCVNLESMNEKREFFYDDFHFTEAGAREVADAVADVLLNTAN